MYRLVYDQDITLLSGSHNSGFLFTVPVLDITDDYGVHVKFTQSPYFLRRAREGVTDISQWDPPNIGIKWSTESYMHAYAYNCPNISVKLEMQIYSYVAKHIWVPVSEFVNYEGRQVATTEVSDYEDSIDKFKALYKKQGIAVPAHVKIYFDYRTINDPHVFIEDTELGAKLVELKEVILQ